MRHHCQVSRGLFYLARCQNRHTQGTIRLIFQSRRTGSRPESAAQNGNDISIANLRYLLTMSESVEEDRVSSAITKRCQPINLHSILSISPERCKQFFWGQQDRQHLVNSSQIANRVRRTIRVHLVHVNNKGMHESLPECETSRLVDRCGTALPLQIRTVLLNWFRSRWDSSRSWAKIGVLTTLGASASLFWLASTNQFTDRLGSAGHRHKSFNDAAGFIITILVSTFCL